MYYDGAYAPYGENYAESGTADRNFTGQNQDTINSGAYPLYDFLLREYSSTWGRWPSPDPAGLGAVNAGNSQSWNRYAYVVNNPLIFTDSLGLIEGPPGDPWCDPWLTCPPPCLPEFGDICPPIVVGGGAGGGGGGGASGTGTTTGNAAVGGSFPNGESLGVPYGLQIGPFTLWELLGIPDVGFGCDPFGLCGGDVPASGFQAQAAAASPWWIRVTSWGLAGLETVGRYAGLVGILASVAMMPSDVVPPSQRGKPKVPAKPQAPAQARPQPGPQLGGYETCTLIGSYPIPATGGKTCIYRCPSGFHLQTVVRPGEQCDLDKSHGAGAVPVP